MSKLLRLVNSPYEPPIAEACNLIFQVFVPYSKENVTLLVNPSVQKFEDDEKKLNPEMSNIELLQLTVSQTTAESKQIALDFKANNSSVIENNGKSVEIKLMKIDTENIQGQDFLAFEIFVSEMD